MQLCSWFILEFKLLLKHQEYVMDWVHPLEIRKHTYLSNFLHTRYQRVLTETPSWSVNPPWTCLFEAYLSPDPKSYPVKSSVQTILTVGLACPNHSLYQITHHGNFHRHRGISVSERLRLPDPWNLSSISYRKSLLVHGDRYASPQTPNAKFYVLRLITQKLR